MRNREGPRGGRRDATPRPAAAVPGVGVSGGPRCWRAAGLAAAGYRVRPRATLARHRRPTRPPSPAAVLPPRGSTCRPLARPPPVAEPADGGEPATPPRSARRAARRLLADRELGRHVVGRGRPTWTPAASLYRAGPGRSTPASTMKLLTATAALRGARADDHGSAPRSCARGDRLVLVGGGDPFLAEQPDGGQGRRTRPRADLITLARATATALHGAGRRPGRASATTPRCSPGRRSNPTWPAGYLPDERGRRRSRALWVDEGRAPAARCVDRPGGAAGRGLRRGAGAGRHQGRRAGPAGQRARQPRPRSPWSRARRSAQIVAAHPRGQRQQGRRGAGPPGRARGRAATASFAGGAAGCRQGAAPARRAPRRRRDLRRQRAVPRRTG